MENQMSFPHQLHATYSPVHTLLLYGALSIWKLRGKLFMSGLLMPPQRN